MENYDNPIFCRWTIVHHTNHLPGMVAGTDARCDEPTDQEGRMNGGGERTAPWMGIRANACMGDTLGSSGTGPEQQNTQHCIQGPYKVIFEHMQQFLGKTALFKNISIRQISRNMQWLEESKACQKRGRQKKRWIDNFVDGPDRQILRRDSSQGTQQDWIELVRKSVMTRPYGPSWS